tara:strand:+ start:673 stop:888 length:216 start_codon:yes stop_codon:yes gene_type:complete
LKKRKKVIEKKLIKINTNKNILGLKNIKKITMPEIISVSVKMLEKASKDDLNAGRSDLKRLIISEVFIFKK